MNIERLTTLSNHMRFVYEQGKAFNLSQWYTTVNTTADIEKGVEDF